MSRVDLLEEAAAGWLMRREEPGWDELDEAHFQEWLQQSFSHKAAFWRLEHVWRAADEIGAVVEDEIRPIKRFAERIFKPAALAASIAFVVLATYGILSPSIMTPVSRTEVQARKSVSEFSTAVGRQKTVALADGSKIELNTATSVRAALCASCREAWLDQGEAFFDIEHMPDRPFLVHVGGQTVTVLGTQFSIRRMHGEIMVSVLHGKVRVGSQDARLPNSATTLIETGDIAVSGAHSTLVVHDAGERIRNALAWRDGKLSFDRSTLADVVSEFNRYNDRQIVIEDPNLAMLQLGGSVELSNADAFLRLLQDAYGVKIKEEEARIKISGF
jgi:transmembrane sensor